MQVDVFLWKEYPSLSNGSQNAHLEVAIPPADFASHIAEPVTDSVEEQQDEPTPTLSHAELLEVLSSLPSVMFDTLMSRANIPQGFISPSHSPAATRAHQVADWFGAQGESVKQHFMKELRRLVPGRL